jgi:hypothetical protein
MAAVYDRRNQRLVAAQEFRQLAFEAREGLTPA